MTLTRSLSSPVLASLMFAFIVFALCMTSQEGHASSPNDQVTEASSPPIIIDPDVIDSEWNHHVAGYTLIGSAVLLLLSLSFPRTTFLRAVWPFLFVAAGLYLLAWSDKETWPRGFLSWTWLIHHDAEARQHKIYGILLLVMGAVEYLRWRGKLRPWWRTWAFPIIATFGACLLLVHDHGGNSGLAPGWDNAEKAARVAEMARVSGQNLTLVAEQPTQSALNMAAEHHDMAQMMGSSANNEKVSSEPNSMPQPDSGHAGHVMSPAMLHVKAQHLWFTLVGIAIAFFKFIDDGGFWRKRFVPYFWPSGMLLLGTLLVLYTETL